MIQIHVLPFGKGECFMLVFQGSSEREAHIMVIDSGYARTAQRFKAKLQGLMEQYGGSIWMLLTHIDQDHIGGYRYLFQNPGFREYVRITGFYYNTVASLQKLEPGITSELVNGMDSIPTSTETSAVDAVTLEALLEEKGTRVHTGLQAGGEEISLADGIRMKILSPSPASLSKYRDWLDNQEDLKTAAEADDYRKPLEELWKAAFSSDPSAVNASSLSVLISAYGRTLLFLGDSLAGDVAASLRTLGYSEDAPLKADVVKLAHHGSRHNTNPKLLRLIQGKYFLFSGDGGRGCPDKETLARVVRYQENPVFWFAYDLADRIFTLDEREKYHIQAECATEWRLDEDA